MEKGHGLVKLKKIECTVIGIFENCPVEQFFKIYQEAVILPFKSDLITNVNFHSG